MIKSCHKIRSLNIGKDVHSLSPREMKIILCNYLKFYSNCNYVKHSSGFTTLKNCQRGHVWAILLWSWFLLTDLLVVWFSTRWGCQEVLWEIEQGSWAPCSGQSGRQLFPSHLREGWSHPVWWSWRSVLYKILFSPLKKLKVALAAIVQLSWR